MCFRQGYLLAEVPSNMLLARSRPSIFLPALMFVWGCMSIGAKGIHNLAGLVAFRFMLGIVEAGFFPGVILLLSCWYKVRKQDLAAQFMSLMLTRLVLFDCAQPNELSKRLAIFYSASLMAGAFGGLLAGVITQYMDGLGNTPGWQWVSAGIPARYCEAITQVKFCASKVVHRRGIRNSCYRHHRGLHLAW